MMSIVIGSLVLSLLHAIIPNHWIPLVAIARKESWSLSQTLQITFLSGMAHAISTIVIGVVLSVIGLQLSNHVEQFTTWVAPVLLVVLGIFFIWQHHRHQHFKLNQLSKEKRSKKGIVGALVIAMFLSPCFEIEAYYLLAGAEGWGLVIFISALYLTVTVTGMLLWVRLVYKSLVKFNWHAIEHNAGIITGSTLILTGVLSFFIH